MRCNAPPTLPTRSVIYYHTVVKVLQFPIDGSSNNGCDYYRDHQKKNLKDYHSTHGSVMAVSITITMRSRCWGPLLMGNTY